MIAISTKKIICVTCFPLNSVQTTKNIRSGWAGEIHFDVFTCFCKISRPIWSCRKTYERESSHLYSAYFAYIFSIPRSHCSHLLSFALVQSGRLRSVLVKRSALLCLPLSPVRWISFVHLSIRAFNGFDLSLCLRAPLLPRFHRLDPARQVRRCTIASAHGNRASTVYSQA